MMKCFVLSMVAVLVMTLPARALTPAPAATPLEQSLPGTAPVISTLNLKGLVAGYGFLLQNAAVQKLLEQLHLVLPEADQLVAEVGIAGQLHRGVQVGSTFLLRGAIDQQKLLAKLAEHGITLTPSVYRGVPLHTGPFKGLSLEIGLVADDCTLVSLDPSPEHPLNKRTIDTLRGTQPSFAAVTGFQPQPRALFSSVMKTEAIAAALAQHGIPAGLVKHVDLASVEALPALLKLKIEYALRCDTEENAKRLKTLIKRLHFLLVVLPGFLSGDFSHPFKIVQDGRRVILHTSLP
jgi:hypothetical protein